jgi:hypothetical protein
MRYADSQFHPGDRKYGFICFEVNLVKKGFETRCVAQELQQFHYFSHSPQYRVHESLQHSWSGEHDVSTSQRAYEEVTNLSNRPSRPSQTGLLVTGGMDDWLLCRISGVHAL